MPFSRAGGSGRRRRSSGLTMPACWSVTGGRRTAASPTPPIKPSRPICCAARATWRATIPAPRSPPASRSPCSRRSASALARRGRHLAAWRRRGPWKCADSPGSGPGSRRPYADMQQIAAHLTTELPARILFDPAFEGAPSTPCVRPWSTERICGRNRSARGAPLSSSDHQRADAPFSIASSTLPRCWSNSFARPSPPFSSGPHCSSPGAVTPAVNRTELAHSIRALYGSGFDAEGYLRRFFDVDFRLPEPDRKAFIDALLDATQINDYFLRRTQDWGAQQDNYGNVYSLLKGFFQAPDLSLRRIAQAIHRLGLVFATLRSDQQSFAIMTTVALIIRTIDADLYHRFCRGEASDLDVVDKMFALPGVITLTEDGAKSFFERVLIMASCDDVSGLSAARPSPLLQRYQKLVDDEETDLASHDKDREHAKKVTVWAERYRQNNLTDGPKAFRASVQQIELLFPGLIDERSGAASQDS